MRNEKSELTELRQEMHRICEGYKQKFWQKCCMALAENHLAGKATAYPDPIPVPNGYKWKEPAPESYEGKFEITENHGDLNIPFRLHFKSDKKAEGDVIPAFQRIFTPTVEQSDDLTKWVKDSICPLFEKKEK